MQKVAGGCALVHLGSLRLARVAASGGLWGPSSRAHRHKGPEVHGRAASPGWTAAGCGWIAVGGKGGAALSFPPQHLSSSRYTPGAVPGPRRGGEAGSCSPLVERWTNMCHRVSLRDTEEKQWAGAQQGQSGGCRGLGATAGFGSQLCARLHTCRLRALNRTSILMGHRLKGSPSHQWVTMSTKYTELVAPEGCEGRGPRYTSAPGRLGGGCEVPTTWAGPCPAHSLRVS